jgi:hypothetical protein
MSTSMSRRRSAPTFVASRGNYEDPKPICRHWWQQGSLGRP